MALKRYVGPYPEVRVSVAGHDFGIVENGGSVAIPDELAGSVGWSEHWEDGTDTAPVDNSRVSEPVVMEVDN